MKKFLVALTMMLGFSGVAHASIMFEPYLGYETGKFSDPDGKGDGVNIGARLAYHTPIFLWLGLDGNVGISGNFKPDSSSIANSDMKRNSLYGVVGVDFPILLRAWAGYAFMDDQKLDSPHNSTLKNKTYKVGVGFTGLPFISLNVEYIKAKVDKVDGGTLTGADDIQSENVMFSVSLPLNF